MLKKYYNLGKNVLFPICRSLTGKGTLETLKIIKKNFPILKIKKIKSGTKVYDWKIPSEWNVEDAYVLDKNGKKIINFKINNLHLIGYSVPINKFIKKKDLIKNLYFIKKKPDAIPYITSYYKKRWGFCISYNNFKKINKNYLSNDLFKVVILTKFKKNGYLNYGELILKGRSHQEILISTYVCHPSMANNELSGPIVSMSLINYYRKLKLSKTLRFVFIPETIGSIAYINKNLKYLKKNVIGGYNLSCIGDNRNHSCMLSKYKNKPSDLSLIEAYKKLKIKNFKVHSFLKRGSDERQYNSPGVDLPISSIFRTRYGDFPEYHTSLDNFDLVNYKGLKGGFDVAKTSINILLKNVYPKCNIICEPQMGKRNMYTTLSRGSTSDFAVSFMDFMQYSDGTNSLYQISRLIKKNFLFTKKIYFTLLKKNIISA